MPSPLIKELEQSLKIIVMNLNIVVIFKLVYLEYATVNVR